MGVRYFAIVPAAGNSARMGEPKLLLSLAGQPLILHTLSAWKRSRADRIVVVVRPGDDRLAVAVRNASQSKVQGPKSKVEAVVPDALPADMKASVQVALRHIEQQHEPSDADAFLVAPADMPRLSAAIVDRLIERHGGGSTATIMVPTIGGRRGHPVLISWSHASEVFGLQADEGLKTIVERHQPVLVPCEDLVVAGEYPFADVDTREEYEGLVGGAGE